MVAQIIRLYFGHLYPGVMIPFLVLPFIFYIGVTRIIAETGLVRIRRRHYGRADWPQIQVPSMAHTPGRLHQRPWRG